MSLVDQFSSCTLGSNLKPVLIESDVIYAPLNSKLFHSSKLWPGLLCLLPYSKWNCVDITTNQPRKMLWALSYTGSWYKSTSQCVQSRKSSVWLKTDRWGTVYCLDKPFSLRHDALYSLWAVNLCGMLITTSVGTVSINPIKDDSLPCKITS